VGILLPVSDSRAGRASEAGPARTPPIHTKDKCMAKVLIAFYSRTGVTEVLAKTIAEGAQAAGAEVRMRRAREVVGREIMQMAPGWIESAEKMNAEYEAPTAADAEWADAIILGTPTRFGLVSSELKAYLDSLGGLWFQGKLVGKVGSTFCTTSTLHGGNEMTNVGLYIPMMHFGMVLVPPGFADPSVMQGGGSPYGATAVSGMDGAQPNELDLAVARYQGRRVVEVADALRVK